MKIRRLFEDKTNIDIFDFFRKKYEVDEIKDKILILINEYIELNSKHFINEYNFNNALDYIKDMTFEEPFKLILVTSNMNGDKEVKINTDDFNDLLEFIEDPETYKNIKKFNI